MLPRELPNEREMVAAVRSVVKEALVGGDPTAEERAGHDAETTDGERSSDTASTCSGGRGDAKAPVGALGAAQAEAEPPGAQRKTRRGSGKGRAKSGRAQLPVSDLRRQLREQGASGMARIPGPPTWLGPGQSRGPGVGYTPESQARLTRPYATPTAVDHYTDLPFGCGFPEAPWVSVGPAAFDPELYQAAFEQGRAFELRVCKLQAGGPSRHSRS